MTAAIVIALLSVLALAYVVAPLRRTDVAEEPPDPRAEAEARKDAALSAILDLEDEREVGKLSAEDLAALTARYEHEALEALKELDLLGAIGDDPLELEIAALRAEMTCPACGARREPGKVCGRCGAD